MWSAFTARTRFRAKIAPWVTIFDRVLPSHRAEHGRRFGGCVEDPGGTNGRLGQPRDAEIESLNIASPCAPLMNTKSRGSDAILSENEAIAPPARRPTLASGGGAWVAIYGSQPTTTLQIKPATYNLRVLEPTCNQNKTRTPSPAPKWF